MDIQTLKTFFLWCTLIDGALLLIGTAVFLLAGDWAYSVQIKWFPLARETFNVATYLLVGMFKIIFLVFNAVPYVALLIVR